MLPAGQLNVERELMLHRSHLIDGFYMEQGLVP